MLGYVEWKENKFELNQQCIVIKKLWKRALGRKKGSLGRKNVHSGEKNMHSAEKNVHSAEKSVHLGEFFKLYFSKRALRGDFYIRKNR